MHKLCGACGTLPTSHIITEGLEVIGNKAYDSGGFADVWQGRFKGRKVAIKALRTYANDDPVKVKKVGYRSALESDIVSFSALEILQGNSSLERPVAPECVTAVRCIHIRISILHGVTLDGTWQRC
jgi:hypothetical protein